jgi:hypothetical protein
MGDRSHTVGTYARWRWGTFAALAVMFAAGFFRTGILVRGSDVTEIAKSIEIAAVLVALFTVFCWAVLYERAKAKEKRKDGAS